MLDLRARILCNPLAYAKLLINFTFLVFIGNNVFMFVICLQTTNGIHRINEIWGFQTNKNEYKLN
jgi:hypothetical protein